MKDGKQKRVFYVGQLVRLNFPFKEDTTRFKFRPALIIEVVPDGYVVIPITSQEKHRGKDCYLELILLVTSFINVCHPVIMKGELIMEKYGEINKLQLALVLDRYRRMGIMPK